MDKSSTIMILGSCFADEIGRKLIASGLDVCLNPFGTLFNPASILSSISRMQSGTPFTAEECVEMGANAGKICSFSHHTSFARTERKDFLDNANKRLAESAAYWHKCSTVIISLGTAWVWKHLPEEKIVSNCLKRPGYEFSHELLQLGEVQTILENIIASAPGKEFIFTVSPIRHLWNGAHSNQISKATLLLAIDSLQARHPEVRYFPAYETVLDDLRDYRWFAQDKVHPSPEAVDKIWEAFQLWAGL